SEIHAEENRADELRILQILVLQDQPLLGAPRPVDLWRGRLVARGVQCRRGKQHHRAERDSHAASINENGVWRSRPYEAWPDYRAVSASRICCSAPGSSIVVRSPGSRPSASAWIDRLSVLPERVFGNSDTKCTAFGRAIAPSCRSTVSITCRSNSLAPPGVPSIAGSLA